MGDKGECRNRIDVHTFNTGKGKSIFEVTVIFILILDEIKGNKQCLLYITMSINCTFYLYLCV